MPELRPLPEAKKQPVLIAGGGKLKEALQTLLAAEGYSVQVTTSGEDALEALTEPAPQVVLLDLAMQDISVLQWLRQFLAVAHPAVPSEQRRKDLPAETSGVRERPVRGERSAMERAALGRVLHLLEAAIARAPTTVLENALAEPDTPAALSGILADGLFDEVVGGDWGAALLRGSQVKRELLQEAGGGLKADQVGEMLGISRAAVDKRRRQGALLGLKLPSGDIAYPAIQFAKDDVIKGLPEVLRSFHLSDPWMQLDLLLAKDDELLGGRSGFDALRAGDVENVKRRVAGSGEQGL